MTRSSIESFDCAATVLTKTGQRARASLIALGTPSSEVALPPQCGYDFSLKFGAVPNERFKNPELVESMTAAAQQPR